MTCIELTTELATTAQRAFDLSLDVGVHTGSMARSGERVVGGVRDGAMALGDTVTFAARHFGVRWRMTSRITAWQRPARFVDEQDRGPFRSWWHEHTFAWDEARQVTVARDVVHFTAPFGLLGRLVTRVVLERYMRRILVERNAYLAQVCAGGIPAQRDSRAASKVGRARRR
ncbi:SRPBCC family protein [Micromonosporaceae bacterium Da 78-11]